MCPGTCRPLTVQLAGLFIVLAAGRAGAQPIVEGFENVTNLRNVGWVFINASTSPDPNNTWVQGDSSPAGLGFPAHAGTANSYAVAGFESTTSTMPTGVTLSNWLITPLRTLSN